VKIQAALLWALPVRGNAGVDVRLVDDLGNQLWSVGDGVGVGCRQLSTRYGVLVAVDEEKTDQDPDMLHGEAQYKDGGQNEENDAFAHGCCWCSCLLLRRCSARVSETKMLRTKGRNSRDKFGRDGGGCLSNSHGRSIIAACGTVKAREEEEEVQV
jgi:hypothetical protein